MTAAATSRERPVHFRPSMILLVFVGGTVGTGTREALSLLFPPMNDIPVAIFAVNIVGAFLLGLLLDALARRGPDLGTRRALRLLLGTGFMGGFTTYSALATDTAVLIATGRPAAGIGYALATVLVGGAASIAGMMAAQRLTHEETRS